MNHELLKYIEDVIQILSLFCFDAEHQTLGELSDNTLSKSISSLALRVSSLLLFFSAFGSLFNLTLFSFFLRIGCYPGDQECTERAEAETSLLQDEGKV